MTGYSPSTRCWPHSVPGAQGNGSPMISWIVRGLHPTIRLSSLVRKTNEEAYKQHQKDKMLHHLHGHLMYQMFGFTEDNFQHCKKLNSKLKAFDNEYKVHGDKDYKDLEFTDEATLTRFIKVLEQHQQCLKTVENFCDKEIQMCNKLNDRFKVIVGEGIMKDLKRVRWDIEKEHWININDETDIIKQSNDWDESSVIFSNDYDKLSKNELINSKQNNNDNNEMDSINDSELIDE